MRSYNKMVAGMNTGILSSVWIYSVSEEQQHSRLSPQASSEGKDKLVTKADHIYRSQAHLEYTEIKWGKRQRIKRCNLPEVEQNYKLE